jgi:16S rRNA (uracil1498-N3)-methyltransferase
MVRGVLSMSKIRIYIKPDQLDKLIKLEERGIVHKIKDVLRLKINDELYVFDGEGVEYLYKIKEAGRKFILIEQEKIQKQEAEPKKKVILGFPLVGEQRIDFILQKATELGVSDFIPFVCQRSTRVRSANKLERWRGIIIEAVRQSERLWIPCISDILEFDELIKLEYKIKLAGFINGGSIESVSKLKEGDVFIAIGPVGDFSPDEYDKLRENNFKFIKLSDNLLRVETAAMFSVGLIRYFIDR